LSSAWTASRSEMTKHQSRGFMIRCEGVNDDPHRFGRLGPHGCAPTGEGRIKRLLGGFMIPPGGVHGDRNSWATARALDMTGIANLASGLLPLLWISRRARISPRVAIPCNLRAHRLTSRPSSFGEAATGARPIAPPERPGRGVHSGPLLPLLVSYAGARFWPFDGDDAVSFPRRWCEPQSRPAPSRPSPPTCWPARQRWGSAAEPSSIDRGSSDVFGVPLFDAAGCLQDDAPVRRASRLRTTSDGARCAH